MRLAILGGETPATTIPISQPTLPEFAPYAAELEKIFQTRQITNGRWVRRLEEEAAGFLQVPEVVAVSSATSGLILVAKLLGLKGKVILPSFTFPATMHILLWNQLEPLLVDCDPESFNIDPDQVSAHCDETVSAVVPVYIFGNAPDWGRLEPVLEQFKLRCFSDAAHGLGTRLGERRAGSFGDAEIFSLAPTKVTIAGEGGLIATKNSSLARDLRIARNYGNPGSYDCEFAGLNARQSEIHALLALMSLEQTASNIARRGELVQRYRDGLEGLESIRFQRIDPECNSTHNYFAIRIDSGQFGLTNTQLQSALEADSIQSRIYFYPPLHMQSRFTDLPGFKGEFPATERICREVLCLPLFSHMTDGDIDRVIDTVRTCGECSDEIRNALADKH